MPFDIGGTIYSGLEIQKFAKAGIVTNGLVLHLDAAYKNSYPKGGTTWYELSGNGYNGTLTNGPTYNSDNGGSIVFDGVDDVGIVSNFALSSNYTHEGVFYISPSDSGFSGFFSNMNSPSGISGVGNGWLLRIEPNGNLQLYVKNNSSTYNLPINVSNFRSTYAGKILHIAYVCSVNYNAVYVNGVLLAQHTGNPTGTLPSNSQLLFGAYDWGIVSQRYYLSGNSYTIKSYNRALSADEIRQNYYATKNRFEWEYTTTSLPPVTSGLQLYLDANQTDSYSGTGTTWNDISGNNRHFNWYSSPTFSEESGVKYFTTLGNICRGPASNSFGIDNTSGYTIFMIFRQLSLVDTGAFNFVGSGLYSRGIFTHCTWSDNIIYFDQGGCCNADTRTQVASGGLTSYSIVAFRRLTNSSTRSIWKNGTSLVTNTASAANMNLTSTAVDLGGETIYYGGNSSTWNARLNSFLVYNRGLSDAEMVDVTSYIQNKLGI